MTYMYKNMHSILVLLKSKISFNISSGLEKNNMFSYWELYFAEVKRIMVPSFE